MCTSFKHSGQVELCMHFVQINLTFALNMLVPWRWCRPAASWNWLHKLSPKSVAEAWGRIWRLCFWAKAIINGMLSISSCTCPGIRSNPQIWPVFLSSPVQTCKLPPFKPDELYVPGGSWSFCPFPRRGVLHIEGLKGCLNKKQQWHQVVRTIQDISSILALWNISLFTCYCYTVLFHQLPSAAPNTAIIGSHYLANHVKVGMFGQLHRWHPCTHILEYLNWGRTTSNTPWSWMFFLLCDKAAF